ncbi:dihydroxyacetone kinase subunit DhaK [Aerococcus sp. UMB1112A]|uniref:dihydroxyacetone kinase subunit DhaK n=1 Tax=Aerococcus sp. UMB1112A TaxID=3050609 RepID=UPI00254AE21E|nr:dihydroxyacetone kinase subunit DhaK [Aerococcus sp. UMB1112A]MDK8502204.1 dihydroxyacetone kinase subunit DhaK [Aerococcus sp. UMB1112A]
MKKIINQASDVVDEMLSGMVLANPKIERIEDTGILIAKYLPDQVSVISGGGSGHEPSHASFIGDGMLAGAVCGQVFTSPTSDQVYRAIQEANQGQGVMLVIKNYSGDIMNFEMAMEMAEMDDIPVAKVVVDDDIAVEDSDFTQGKRGVAGTVFVHKILGAAARSGGSLADLEALGQRVVANLSSIGLALSGATVPESGKQGFNLADDEIEFGVGIHGEPGYKREKLQPSRAMAQEMLEKLKAYNNWQAGDRYAILVNGMGATPLMEQYIFLNDVMELLEVEDLDIAFTKVGNLMTSIDMAGISLTFLKLEDDWLDLLQADVDVEGW